MLGWHLVSFLAIIFPARALSEQSSLNSAIGQHLRRSSTSADSLALSDDRTGALATSELEANWPRQPGMNVTMLQRWYSPECVQHFDKTVPLRVNGTWPRTNPRRTTREDFCQGGRAASVRPRHKAQDIVIVKELRMVYVENRKAASSSIRHLLSKYFHSNWKWSCKGMPEACRVIDRRCSSECLDADQLQDYFFFSFVRDPMERFYSALKESLVMWNEHHLEGEGRESLSSEECNATLNAMLNTSCGVDHHLESQAMSLSTHLPLEGDGKEFEIHYDYLGRTEQLADDMAIVLELAQHKAGHRLEGNKTQDLVGELRETHDNTGNALLQTVLTVRDEAMDAKVREVYSQDLACFAS